MTGIHRISGGQDGNYSVNLGLTYTYPPFMIFGLIHGGSSSGYIRMMGMGMIYTSGQSSLQTNWVHVVSKNNGFQIDRYTHSPFWDEGFWLKYWVIDYQMEVA